MKRFSLPLYYLIFLLYLVGSFFLHMFFFMGIVSLFWGDSGGVAALFLGLRSFPLGLWNFLFFLFTPPVEQASKPQVWIGSILGLPLLVCPVLAFMIGSSVLLGSSYMFYLMPPLLLYLLGIILSNAIVYALAYAVKFLWKKMRAGKQA